MCVPTQTPTGGAHPRERFALHLAMAACAVVTLVLLVLLETGHPLVAAVVGAGYLAVAVSKTKGEPELQRNEETDPPYWFVLAVFTVLTFAPALVWLLNETCGWIVYAACVVCWIWLAQEEPAP